MTTINDIITIMDKDRFKGCKRCKGCKGNICYYCHKYNFCTVDTYFIAYDYIKREGVI